MNRKMDKSLLSDLINPYLIVYTNENEKSMKNFFQNRVPAEFLRDIRGENELAKLKAFEAQVNADNEASSAVLAATRFESVVKSADNYQVYVNNRDDSIRVIEGKVRVH